MPGGRLGLRRANLVPWAGTVFDTPGRQGLHQRHDRHRGQSDLRRHGGERGTDRFDAWQRAVDTGTSYTRDPSTAGYPTFNNPDNGTTNAPYQALPAGNSQLQPTPLRLSPGQTGCIFYGPTKSPVRARNARAHDGHQPEHHRCRGPTSRGCGTWPARPAGVQTEQSMPLPGNGIVYVANMPSGSGTCLTEYETHSASWLTNDTDSDTCQQRRRLGARHQQRSGHRRCSERHLHHQQPARTRRLPASPG